MRQSLTLLKTKHEEVEKIGPDE